jgi:RNA polymerase sigma factor (TIGR02999 family)
MGTTRSPDIDPVAEDSQASPRAVVDDLFRMVYDELRVLARRQLARLNPGQTLSPTALVHDVYVRLAKRPGLDLRDHQHFRALASRAMRQVIIDYIRRRGAQKRAHGSPVDGALSIVANPATTSEDDLLALDESLTRLEALDSRQAQIVELRFFGGLEVEEVAGALGLSERTVKREWQKARAFLLDSLRVSAG